MNMRLPRYLRDDSDPALSNVPINDTPVEIADVEYDWMVEELENAEIQAEQALMEDAFIEACFEEMLAEEEAQWHHFTYLVAPNQESATVPLSIAGPFVPQVTPLQLAVPCMMPCISIPAETIAQQVADQIIFLNSQPINCSSLNPEAPEFVPKGSS